MALGVLEPKSNERVPGTVHIDHQKAAGEVLASNLKHGTGRNSGIVLVPQPSDSPNDPLNWPHRKKLFHSWFLSFGAALASGTCFFLNPAHTQMSKQIHTTVTQLARTVSLLMMGMGISSVLSSPIARIYGKRPVFIGLNIIGIIGYGVLLAKPTDMHYIYAGRFLWGFGMSGLEYLVSTSVGDLFFVHQRGFHLALWHFALSAGNSLGQVIASQIVKGQNYVWAFRYAVIFMSIYTVLLFFLCPETTYNRAVKYDNDVREMLVGDATESDSDTTASQPIDEKAPHSTSFSEPTIEYQEKRYTYLQELKLYNGKFSNKNILKSCITPPITLLLPGVAWAAYTYGCLVAFSGSLSVSLSQLFTAAPYNFTTAAVGLTTLSPFVAVVFGNFIPGPVADWLVKSMSKRNNGIYEPEFRNILSVPALIFGAVGYWGFGLAIHYRLHWFVPVFLWGVATLSGSVLSLISNTYLLDCHRKYAQDGYAAVTLIKSVFTFATSFFINDWLTKSGPKQVFFIIGTIHCLGCIWGILLYVYGKRIRLATHKNAFIQNAIKYCESRE